MGVAGVLEEGPYAAPTELGWMHSRPLATNIALLRSWPACSRGLISPKAAKNRRISVAASEMLRLNTTQRALARVASINRKKRSVIRNEPLSRSMMSFANGSWVPHITQDALRTMRNTTCRLAVKDNSAQTSQHAGNGVETQMGIRPGMTWTERLGSRGGR